MCRGYRCGLFIAGLIWAAFAVMGLLGSPEHSIIAAAEGNLVFYEPFEEGDEKGLPEGWSGTGELVRGVAKEGKGSILVNDDSETAYVALISQLVEVTPNTTYTLSAWARTDDITDNGGRIAVLVYEKDENRGGNRPAHWLWFEKSEKWVYASITFRTAPTTHFLQLLLYPAASGGVGKKGKAWFDELRIVEGEVKEKVIEVASSENAVEKKDGQEPILRNAFGGPVPVEDVVDICRELPPEEFWAMIDAPEYRRNDRSPWEVPLLREYFFGLNPSTVKRAEDHDSLPRVSGMLGKPVGAPKVIAEDIKYRPILSAHGNYSTRYYPRCMEDVAELYKDAFLVSGDVRYYDRMEELLKYLLYAQYGPDGSNGFVKDHYPEDWKIIKENGFDQRWRGGWDYLFDWEWRDAYGYQWHLHEPDHHVNSRAARTMVRGYEVTSDKEYLKAAWEFVYYQVPRYGFHTGIWKGKRYYWTEYNPSGEGNPTTDATDNIQACVALSTAMVGYYYGDSRMLEFSRGLLWYLVREFETDGQWYYDGAENPMNQRRALSPGHQIWTLTHSLEAMPYLFAGGVPIDDLTPVFTAALEWYTTNPDYRDFASGRRFPLAGYEFIKHDGRAGSPARVVDYIQVVVDGAEELTISKNAYVERARDGKVSIKVSKVIPSKGTTGGLETLEETVLEVKPFGVGKLANLRFKFPFELRRGDIYKVEYGCTYEAVYITKPSSFELKMNDKELKVGDFILLPENWQVNADNFLSFPESFYFPRQI